MSFYNRNIKTHCTVLQAEHLFCESDLLALVGADTHTAFLIAVSHFTVDQSHLVSTSPAHASGNQDLLIKPIWTLTRSLSVGQYMYLSEP